MRNCHMTNTGTGSSSNNFITEFNPPPFGWVDQPPYPMRFKSFLWLSLQQRNLSYAKRCVPRKSCTYRLMNAIDDSIRTTVIGEALPHIPWQNRPTGHLHPVWRHSGNPVIVGRAKRRFPHGRAGRCAERADCHLPRVCGHGYLHRLLSGG